MFYLYQPHLTDTQIDEVNANGWDAHAAYSRTTVMNDDNAWDRVMGALPYYSHAATVDAADENAVFKITNIGPEAKITRHGPMRSGSVGDVIIRADESAACICLPMGWLELSSDQIDVFMTNVGTRMVAA